MGEVYAWLLDNGFDAAYLDNCTLLDLDLFLRQANALRKKQGPRLS